MEIKIPKEKWDLKSTVYSTSVKCPRCGLERYVSVCETGPKWKQWLGAEDKNWDQLYCDRCGEQIIVYRTGDIEVLDELKDQVKAEAQTLQPRVMYRIEAIDKQSSQASRTYGYLEQYSPVLRGEDNFTEEWYRLVVFDDKNSDGVIIHCGPLDNCQNYFATHFYIFEET